MIDYVNNGTIQVAHFKGNICGRDCREAQMNELEKEKQTKLGEWQ